MAVALLLDSAGARVRLPHARAALLGPAHARRAPAAYTGMLSPPTLACVVGVAQRLLQSLSTFSTVNNPLLSFIQQRYCVAWVCCMLRLAVVQRSLHEGGALGAGRGTSGC